MGGNLVTADTEVASVTLEAEMELEDISDNGPVDNLSSELVWGTKHRLSTKRTFTYAGKECIIIMLIGLGTRKSSPPVTNSDRCENGSATTTVLDNLIINPSLFVPAYRIYLFN